MWRVLLVDDERSIRNTLGSFLQAEGYSVSTASEYDEALDMFSSGEFDLVVSDIVLGRSSGVDLLHAVRNTSPDCPVILITGNPSLDSATDGLRLGAFDYLQKPVLKAPFLEVTRRALQVRALQQRNKLLEQEIRQHKERLEEKVIAQTHDLRRTNEALRKSEGRYRTLISTIPEIIAELDLNLNIVWMNEVGLSFFGETIVGTSVTKTVAKADEIEMLRQKVRELFGSTTEVASIELTHLDVKGHERKIEWTCKLLKDVISNTVGIFCTGRDITEKQKLEERVRSTSRLEAIGQLAGGVAHDFNNILSAILAQANLLRSGRLGANVLIESAKVIEVAVQHAQSLTTKLLGFARGNKRVEELVDLHSIVRDTISLLDRTIDKRISIRTDFGATHSIVRGDPSQLHQVVLNLAVNSKDAIANLDFNQRREMQIGFATSEVVFKSKKVDQFGELGEGKYIKFSVSDTGCGILPEDLHKIYEPFFSTKDPGKGTGLGLALVYSIVKGHSGAVEVESAVGTGTTFSVYLPLTEEIAPTVHERDEEKLYTGSGSVLVVDDEPMVRDSNRQLLTLLGYEVQVAESGDAAVEFLSQNPDKVSVVLLDMMMPGMSTIEAFHLIRKASPRSSIVLTSGYGLTETATELIKLGALGMVQKPFSLSAISKVISDAMTRADRT